jgi:hypothetical protein
MWSHRPSSEHLRGVFRVTPVLLLLACCGAAAAGDELVRPAEPPNQIHSLELFAEDAATVIEVTASRPMVWLTQRQDEKRLVVELPGTFPGPEVEEIATFEGLVAAVLFEADPAEPRTRLLVLTRGPALTALVPWGDRLRIRLSAVELEPPTLEDEIPPTVEDEIPQPVDEAPVGVPTAEDSSAVRPSSPAELGEDVFELQLGLFSVEDNATGLAADLKRRGYPAYVVVVTNSTGKVFHTVRLGPYATREQARRAEAAYREQEGGETLLRWRPRSPSDGR